MRGVTRDPSGLALGKASVTVHSLDENTDRQIISAEDGSFLIENLKPGHHQLIASKPGFENSVPVAVELSARQSLRVDIPLALESQTETVNVVAVSEQVNTERPESGASDSSGLVNTC